MAFLWDYLVGWGKFRILEYRQCDDNMSGTLTYSKFRGLPRGMCPGRFKEFYHKEKEGRRTAVMAGRLF